MPTLRRPGSLASGSLHEASGACVADRLLEATHQVQRLCHLARPQQHRAMQVDQLAGALQPPNRVHCGCRRQIAATNDDGKYRRLGLASTQAQGQGAVGPTYRYRQRQRRRCLLLVSSRGGQLPPCRHSLLLGDLQQLRERHRACGGAQGLNAVGQELLRAQGFG